MNTSLVCRDVRPAIANDRSWVVVASSDEKESVRAIDPTDTSKLAEVRDRLQAQGIALGGCLQPAQRSKTPDSVATAFEIVAHDEHGDEHRLIADSVEEYGLSTGSTLYYLYVPEAPLDCRWLVGRAFELTRPSPTESRREIGTRARA